MLNHTPYDGSHPLFKIGLEPLDPKDWIEVDDQIGFYLEEKARLDAAIGDKVFVEEADTRDAQQEVLDLLVDHLREHHSDTHTFEGGEAQVAGRKVALGCDGSPLKTAAQLVQEDLILMRKGEAGWRLAAASLHFPSSWTLLEKFSKPLDQIHAPVPGFATGTRNASLIERIFDNLQVDLPARRFNWSVSSDDALYHADRDAEHLSTQNLAAGAFLRIEHQTLRKLPVSGDILFTVRIHLDPMSTLETHPRRAEICAGFIELLRAMNADELAYKGLTVAIDDLIHQVQIIGSKG